ncbi:MAG: lysophospholipid acyltransferase family protein [Planctomycetota bacterium]
MGEALTQSSVAARRDDGPRHPAEHRAGWLNGVTVWVFRTFAWLVVRVCFGLRVVNPPRIDGPFVLVANHASFLDPILLGVAAGQRVYFMMTTLHFRSPMLGWFYRWVRCIPIALRGSNREPLRIARRVLERGDVLAVFPEGGISRDGAMLCGSPGAVSLVLDDDVPIIAAHIEGAAAAMPPGRLPRPARVTVRFADPIRIDELLAQQGPIDRRQRLRAATRAIMDRIAATGGVQSREGWLEKRASA